MVVGFVVGFVVVGFVVVGFVGVELVLGWWWVGCWVGCWVHVGVLSKVQLTEARTSPAAPCLANSSEAPAPPVPSSAGRSACIVVVRC